MHDRFLCSECSSQDQGTKMKPLKVSIIVHEYNSDNSIDDVMANPPNYQQVTNMEQDPQADEGEQSIDADNTALYGFLNFRLPETDTMAAEDAGITTAKCMQCNNIEDIEKLWLNIANTRLIAEEKACVILLRQQSKIMEIGLINNESSFLPLLNKVSKEHWPEGGGRYEFPDCSTHFTSETSFLTHLFAHEDELKAKSPTKWWIQKAIGTRLKLRRVTYEGILPRSRLQCDTIIICPIPGCSFISNDGRRLEMHLSHADITHDEYFERFHMMGELYAKLVTFIKKFKKIPSIDDRFETTT